MEVEACAGSWQAREMEKNRDDDRRVIFEIDRREVMR
jgi:hypothetical protein